MNNILITIVILISLFLLKDDLIDHNLYASLIKILIIPVLLIPKLFKKFISDDLELIYILFIIISYFLGSIINFYHKIYFYDKFAHFISGIFTAYIGLILCKNKINSSFIRVLFIFGFVFMIAGLWEIFEYTTDYIFNKDAQNVLTTGINDTMQDIISAFLGSIIIIIVKYKDIKKLCN